MEARKLLDALLVAEKLKNETRHCYTSKGRHESVAEHSWMMTLMAYFMKDEFPEANMDKVIQMCIIHDLGEAFTGDIPTFEKTSEDEQVEENALYTVKVVKVEDFGCFCQLWPGCEGLVHVSQLDVKRVDKPSDVVKVGDEIVVKNLGYDKRGRLNLSRKEAMMPEKKDKKEEKENVEE